MRHTPVARHSRGGSIEAPGTEGERNGRGCASPHKILGLFHLKWLILVQITLYILTEMLGYLQLGPRQLLYLLTGPRNGRVLREGADAAVRSTVAAQKIFRLLLEMAHFVAHSVVGLYFYYRAMHFSAKRGITIACRLSVRLSVCLSVCNVGEL